MMLRLLILLLVLGSPALAQDEPRWALVIGNNAYRNVPPLTTAVNDARAMAATLERLGFTVLAHENLDRRGMNRAVRQLADRVLDGIGIVYFAGHGVQLRSGNYLLPVDIEAGEEADVEDDAVSLADLMTLLAGARARLVIAFVDACRDNPLLPGPQGRSLGAVRGLGQPAVTPSGTMVVYSAGTNERALDGLGPGDRSPNGLFVRELLPELERPGVAIDDAVDAAAERVARKAREVGHAQNPAIYKAYRGKFYLKPGEAPPEPPPSDLRAAAEVAFWDSIKASRNPADHEAYLEQFPTGIFARLARNRLAELAAAARQQAAAVVPPRAVEAPAPVQPAVGMYGDAGRKAGEVFRDCPECPELVVVPAGSFTMGSPEGEVGRDSDEGPQHRVTIARPFAVGRYEVTFAEWDACVAGGGCGGYRPSDQGWGRGRRPVINVSWEDAQAYVRWLSGRTGATYRLLSEAEWEYAVRAGTATPFWWGSTITPEQANYDGRYTYGSGRKGEYRQRTVAVDAAGFPANPFGLYHVHGNVWEWVGDCWHGNYERAPADGRPWIEEGCPRRVLRGGSWYGNPWDLRAADRFRYAPDYRYGSVGFRVARMLTP